jgi:ribosomal protein L27
VNQLTVKKVHDRKKKFAGRKAQPNYQLGFKADYGKVMDSGNIYLRNRGY